MYFKIDCDQRNVITIFSTNLELHICCKYLWLKVMYKTTELNKIYYLWFGKCDGITVLPCSEMENLYSVIIWNMHYLIVRFFSRLLFTMFNYVTNRECSNTKSVKKSATFCDFFLQMSSSLLPQKCSSKQATHDVLKTVVFFRNVE